MVREYTNTHNPILPLDIHIPDSEGRTMPDGNLYIYGSFDNRDDVFCSEEYHPVSTPDLKHWYIFDKALQGKDIKWFDNPEYPHYPGIDWTHPTPFVKKMLEHDKANGVDMKEKFAKKKNQKRPPLLFAPDCIAKNGLYYLYFNMSDDTEGVAVSDKPQGPFKNPVQLPIGGIDPSIFIDDDGTPYLYWGQLHSHCVKLNKDMTSLNRNDIIDDLVTEEKHYFHEGSSVRKIGDTYYYVFADMQRGKPTSLGYATGPTPIGPFKYRGIIIDNEYCDPASWNNHGSIEKFNGQWYVFYHRNSRGVRGYRRLCMEPININEDGSIDEVPMTSQGPGAPFKPGETVYGYQACELHGSCFIDVGSKYGEELTNLNKGDKAIFRYVESKNNWSNANFECTGSGQFDIFFNKIKVGKVKVKNGQSFVEFAAKPGCYEVTIKVNQSNNLKLQSFRLN